MVDASEIGLHFYTPKTKGCPKNYSTEELIKGIHSNTFKWRYTNNKYTEDQVLRKIQRGEINLAGSWITVEPDEYRKIRSGLDQERSLLQQRDPRLMKISYNIKILQHVLNWNTNSHYYLITFLITPT